MGCTYSDVINKLGPPDGHIKVAKGNKAIHYGYYEFYFTGDRLRTIQNDHFDPEYPEMMEFSNDLFTIEPAFFRPEQKRTMFEVEQHLHQSDIIFSEIEYFGRPVIQTSSGMIIDFSDEYYDKKSGNLAQFKDIKEHTLLGFRYSS